MIVEDTELSGDVTCDVTGAACFSFGAPGVQLRLNGYSITGKGDPVTGCGGAITGGEFGITTGGRANVSIQGPGLVQRFRNHGVNVAASTAARIQGITSSTNCGSGIFVAGTSFDTVIEGNVSVRNGSIVAGGVVRRHMNRRPQQPGPAERARAEMATRNLQTTSASA